MPFGWHDAAHGTRREAKSSQEADPWRKPQSPERNPTRSIFATGGIIRLFARRNGQSFGPWRSCYQNHRWIVSPEIHSRCPQSGRLVLFVSPCPFCRITINNLNGLRLLLQKKSNWLQGEIVGDALDSLQLGEIMTPTIVKMTDFIRAIPGFHSVSTVTVIWGKRQLD